MMHGFIGLEQGQYTSFKTFQLRIFFQSSMKLQWKWLIFNAKPYCLTLDIIYPHQSLDNRAVYFQSNYQTKHIISTNKRGM